MPENFSCLKNIPSPILTKLYWPGITVLLGVHLFREKSVILVSSNRKESPTMFVLAAAVVLFLLVLAGADLFVSQYNPDELSSMGVQEQ